jgi:hypothetical protein
MWIVELLVVLFFIWLGARLGSIGIGFAGGFGVLVLAIVFGIKPGSIPVDVILIIMSVIAAIAAMQVAGGLDFMVHLAEKVLRSNPRYITFIAPVVTYTMTMFAGTGLTAFSTLPVIAEVAKETGVRPSRPLAIATVASQIAITASPISAAVIFFASELEKVGVSYVQLLMISIPSTFLAVMLAAVVTNFLGKELEDDPVYQDRLAKGLVSTSSGTRQREIKPGAKRSVLIFLMGLIGVVAYATAISGNVGLINRSGTAKRPCHHDHHADRGHPHCPDLQDQHERRAQCRHLQVRYERLRLRPGRCLAGHHLCFRPHRRDQRVCRLPAGGQTLAAGRGALFRRHAALFPGCHHAGIDAGGPGPGHQPGGRHCLLRCGGVPVRAAHLPDPAGGGGI